MNDGQRRVTASVIAIGVLAVALAGLEIGGPLRGVIVLAFLLLGPGLVLSAVLKIDGPVSGWAFVVPLSLTVDALAAGVVLYAGIWSPLLILGIVAVGTSAVGLWLLGDEEPRPSPTV